MEREKEQLNEEKDCWRAFGGGVLLFFAPSLVAETNKDFQQKFGVWPLHALAQLGKRRAWTPTMPVPGEFAAKTCDCAPAKSSTLLS